MQTRLDFDPIRTRFDEPLFVVGGTAVTVASVVSFVVFVLVAYMASWVLRRSLQRVYRRRGLDEGVQHSLDRLLHYAVVALGAFLALDNLGVSITALARLGAILARRHRLRASEHRAELRQRADPPPGAAGEEGRLRAGGRGARDGARHPRAGHGGHRVEQREHHRPNGQFITEAVTNETFGDRRVRVKIKVGVAYGSDVERVRRVLLEIATSNAGVLDEPPPQVLFREFGESSLDFELLVWLRDPRDENATASDLRFAIDRVFREDGIEIPFPQRDLHLRTGWAAGGEG